MDINNQQQTNTFVGGMDTDTSDMYLDSSKYRYAENVRIITNKDSNSGELRIIEGTTLFTRLDDSHEPTYNKFNGSKILAMTSVRDLGILILKKNNQWCIVTFKESNGVPVITQKTKWLNEKIWADDWDGKTKTISTVVRWEADDNIKLYIADGIHDLMMINISDTVNNIEKGFYDLFSSSNIMLPPVEVELTENEAKLPGVLVQYGYVLYVPKGESSTLSVLSDFLQVSKNASMGYDAGVNAGKAVKVTLPSLNTNNNIRVYRIAYQSAGQLPRVDIIFDQKYSNITITDIGQSIENISSAEFVATNKLRIQPKEIESKGDYLFAANLKYGEDEVNEQFKNFSAVCYSSGNYIINEQGQVQDVFSTIAHPDENLLYNAIKDIKIEQLHHHQFDTSDSAYNAQYWNKMNGTVGGEGLCFKWEYVPVTQTINNSSTKRSSITSNCPRTYLRGEVYRFGVRLFDNKGRASSVKWIADIKIPDWNSNENITFGDGTYNYKRYTIKFTPKNTNTSYWDNVDKYEIVQCKRSFEDSYRVAQGLIGFPIKYENESNRICTPNVLTTTKMNMSLCIGRTSGVSGVDLGTNRIYVPYNVKNDTNHLLFACPEYSYQPDDVQSIIKDNKSSIKLEKNFYYIPKGSSYTVSTSTATIPYDTNYGQLLSRILSGASSTDHYPASNFRNAINYVKTDDSRSMAIGILDNQGYYIDSQIYYKSGFGTITPSGQSKVHHFTTTLVKPQSIITGNNTDKLNIKSVYYSDGVKQSTMTKDSSITVKHTSTQVDTYVYYPWTNPFLLHFNGFNDDSTLSDVTRRRVGQAGLEDCWSSNGNVTPFLASYSDIDSPELWPVSVAGMPTSNGNKIMILDANEDVSSKFEYNRCKDNNNNFCFPPICVGTLKKTANPYGGYSYNAIEKSSYLSFGKLADKTQSVTMDKGDGFISLFTYNLCHNTCSSYFPTLSSNLTTYIVPIESTIDMTQQGSDYLYGTATNSTASDSSHANDWWLQSEPDSIAGFNQPSSAYLYNTAYSVLPDIVTYAAEVQSVKTSNNYDSRIHYSQKKINNELIDSWTTFKTVDFTDVDSRYGEITGLKLFKDKLMFLQEQAAGVLSVNDRVIVKDESSANIIVGSGGVLERFDYITTLYGMKPNQKAVETSNDALYWWDGHHREILQYVDGYNINLLQHTKNVANYISEASNQSNRPTIMYDPKNKEVLFNVVNNDALVYNEQTQQFTSVYSFNPEFYCRINENIYTTDQFTTGTPAIYKYNDKSDVCRLFGTKVTPLVDYTVNKEPTYNKVFDIQTFGGRMYGGDYINDLEFDYHTPLKQHSSVEGDKITNREYDFRLTIPRNNDDIYGGRMRGKFMNCVIGSKSSDFDFSLQYVTTKYRMSWS